VSVPAGALLAHPALKTLGLTIPVVQAPMAGAGGIALAQAVQAAGGMGSLPCAMLSAEVIRSSLDTLMSASRAPLNVNFFCHTPKPDSAEAQARWKSCLAAAYKQYQLDPNNSSPAAQRSPFNEAHCALIEKQPPAVVSFHFGLPTSSLLNRVKAAGCQVWSSATTVAEACWLEDNGVDAIIAQGFEAGGHRGLFLDPITNELQQGDAIGLVAHQVGTFSLVPQVVDRVSVPVIAAGGIADGRSMAAALMLGASAVQIGTAYLLSAEATVTTMHRKALINSCAEHTALTNIFSGKPARGVMNEIMRTLGPMSAEVPPFPTAGAALAPLKAAAEADKKPDYSSLWSGQSAALAAKLLLDNNHATEIPSAHAITEWITKRATHEIAQLAAR